MTSHHDSHTITDVKPEIIPGVQTGNGIPHDRYNIRGIAHLRTNRKDDIFRQRRLYIESSRNFGMSVGVAWFPDYGHIVAGIFLSSVVKYMCGVHNL